MTRIELDGLTKFYGDEVGVVDVDLDIPSGRITALLGPSGCGKTTTLKMINGLIEPTRGEVRYDDRSMNGVPAEKREAVMVFQGHMLFPYMSVADNVGFGLKMRGVDRKEIRRRVEEMLERVQLPGTGKRKPTQLSGGQQQRVALARALVVNPRILLLDEPLASLDAHLRSGMRQLIMDIQSELDLTTVIVTHDQTEAVELADKIALIFEGRLHQVGAPPDFYKRPASTLTARFFGSPNFIPGRRRGDTVETDIGALDIAGGPGDDAVTVTIRPESVQLNASSADGANAVEGRIEHVKFLGAATEIGLRVGEHRLLAIADANAATEFDAGDTVSVGLPSDELWAVPRRDGDGDTDVADGGTPSDDTHVMEEAAR